jgi:hypothetical protein
MRVVILLAVLSMFVSLGGCARKAEVAYVDLPPGLPQSHTSGSSPALIPAQTLVASESSVQQRGSRSISSQTQWNTSVVPSSVEMTDTLFDRVEAKAATVGVENLTQADIRGLSYDQIRKLRGY